MDPTVKVKWLEALRSGKYEQGNGALRRVEGNAFCCLGVLADVCGEKWSLHPSGTKYQLEGDIHFWATNTPSYGTLTDQFCQSVGLPVAARTELVSLNDQKRKSFKEIAVYIEEKL